MSVIRVIELVRAQGDQFRDRDKSLSQDNNSLELSYIAGGNKAEDVDEPAAVMRPVPRRFTPVAHSRKAAAVPPAMVLSDEAQRAMPAPGLVSLTAAANTALGTLAHQHKSAWARYGPFVSLRNWSNTKAATWDHADCQCRLTGISPRQARVRLHTRLPPHRGQMRLPGPPRQWPSACGKESQLQRATPPPAQHRHQTPQTARPTAPCGRPPTRLASLQPSPSN